MKQYGGIGRRNNGHMFQYLPQRRTVADNIFKAVLRADFWFEIELIILDPAQRGKVVTLKSAITAKATVAPIVSSS